MTLPVHPRRWLEVRPAGLYCAAGDFHVDPTRAVARAIVTHGHSDHARAGHGGVLATRGTLAIMRTRFGADAVAGSQELAYGEPLRIGEATVRLLPAGHILGSAQVVIEHAGSRVIVSGDYKRRRDDTCDPFVVEHADVFITEATFGLPVFRHPDDGGEIARLLHSLQVFPDRAHLVGVYNLGKCQRVLALLRRAGYDRPVYLHGGLAALCDLYRALGIDLGVTASADDLPRGGGGGEIVLCPPSALADRWSRRFAEPRTALASGWMGVRQRARQRGVELPLVISDHADWDELTATIDEIAPAEVWVTHGREEALVHHARSRGFHAEALNLAGYDEDSA